MGQHLPPGDYGGGSDSPPDEPAKAVNRLARPSAPTRLSRRPASLARPDRQGAICTMPAVRNPTAKRPRRTRAGIACTPFTIDGRDLSGKKNNQDRQQANGSGMHTEHPQLPETPERHCNTSTGGSSQHAVDIPFHVAVKELEAVMNQQAQLVGN
jgi:hypothetical protein